MKLRQIIKSRREELGMNQDELSLRCNICKQTISNFEVGRSQLGSDSIDKVLEVLDLKVGQNTNWFKKWFK